MPVKFLITSLRRGTRFWRAHAEIDYVSEGENNGRMLPEHEGDTFDDEVNLDGEQ